MNKVRNLFSGMLAVLAVLLLTGCGEKDNPVRTSLDVDTSTLTLSVGESAVRMASSKAEDAAITYTSSKPAVATVDQFGKVTAMSEGGLRYHHDRNGRDEKELVCRQDHHL